MGYGRRIVAAGLAIALAGAASASADSTPAVDFDLAFSSKAPGSPTAARLRILYKDPSDPDAKPPPLRELRLDAPAGARFSGNAVPACHASDAELRAEGRDACPAASKVGSGTLSVVTGFGPPLDPFPTDATLFNSGDGIIELFTQQASNRTLAIDRTKFVGPSALEAHPPVTPGGPPDGETSVREVRFTYDKSPLITTPRDCPGSGRWSSRLTYKTSDGGTYSAGSTTPCATGGRKPKPRLHLRVAPRRVPAGRRRRFRVRVWSSSAACARRATIRVAGRRYRTNRRGRARFRLRFRRPGRRRVLAGKRGCRGASVRVVVRR
jgi:hypothetical protein